MDDTRYIPATAQNALLELHGHQCKLVMVGVEAEAVAFLRKLAAARAWMGSAGPFASRCPPVDAQRAFARSLLELPPASIAASSGKELVIV